ncbi:GspE/PulE family protein [Sulfuricurvum sp.]|uniref:GspE/PulE family protein n=1 Tax=Sulfuricurvum sp. TaxID=2025608 RepID=UPI003BAEBA36
MNIKKILTSKQLEVCQKEQYYYQQLGRKKHLLEIAMSHHFIQKKSPPPLFNLDFIKEYEMVVVKENDTTLYIERKELLGPTVLAELEAKTRKKVEQKTIPVREFNQKYQALLGVDTELLERKIKQFNDLEADEKDAVEIFEMVLYYGAQNRASDIHLNPHESFSWLRYRIDGKVQARYLISHELAERFSLIFKERCSLDLVAVNAPQSGGFTGNFQENVIDFRVEIAPAQYGENIVVRLLDKSKNIKTLKSIFPKEHPMAEHIAHFTNLANGFFLVVGPTGSGKTTTLNAILSQRDRLHEIIYTIEDPIEYKVDFVTQYQINEATEFDFPTAIKSVMRQDPDVIVIGEMRDRESIHTALKAAHSGHMVFSTLHTSNSFMAMERIRDEGGDLFILAYSLSGVIAQHLVPKLCDCKVPSSDSRGTDFFESKMSGYEANGCIRCNFTGYYGRTLLSDMVFIPYDMKVRYQFYLALKNSTVFKAWDQFITFSYFQSAQYLFENGESDYDTLSSELLSLGYIREI